MQYVNEIAKLDELRKKNNNSSLSSISGKPTSVMMVKESEKTEEKSEGEYSDDYDMDPDQ